MSLARAYVTLQGALLLLFGILALLKAKSGTLGLLGWLWLSYGVLLLFYPYFYKWGWEFLRDNATYLLFSAFMLAIYASSKVSPPSM